MNHLFFLAALRRTISGPTQSRSGVTSFPSCPGKGQNFPERQREQLSFGGSSTVLRSRPYFLRGIAITMRGGVNEDIPQ